MICTNMYFITSLILLYISITELTVMARLNTFLVIPHNIDMGEKNRKKYVTFNN